MRLAVEQVELANPGHGGIVSISIGLAFAAEGVGPEPTIASADMALYDAKKHGRNRVVSTPGLIVRAARWSSA